MQIFTSLLPILLTLFYFAFAQWKDNRKQFQEKIFELKINSYKDVIEQLGMVHEGVFNFVQVYQEFEGSQAEWEEIERPLFIEYFKKALDLKAVYYRYVTLLPDNILEQLNDLVEGQMGLAAMFHILKANEPHEYYFELDIKIFDFIAECRKDLQTDALNVSVFKRVSYDFYPFEGKLFKRFKN